MTQKSALPYLSAWLEHLSVTRNLSPHTVSAYQRDVIDFSSYVRNLTHATQAEVEAYVASMGAANFNPRTQVRRLAALRNFYDYLLEQGVVNNNPTLDIVPPKLPQSLPKALSLEHAKLLMKTAEGAEPEQLRLRVMLNLLYGCGLRVTELVNLTVADVADGEGHTLRVTGKGNKTRLVPLGPILHGVLAVYLRDARPHFLQGTHSAYLLIGGKAGRPLTRQRVFQLIQAAGEGVGLTLAPHHLRHTFATHLLDNDADLRAVQQMLGHVSLTTTQIYTKVAAQRLHEVLEKYHPLSSGT
ncbi:MAG: tyrosine recombinase [Alphaproteobacteria bacterium]